MSVFTQTQQADRPHDLARIFGVTLTPTAPKTPQVLSEDELELLAYLYVTPQWDGEPNANDLNRVMNNCREYPAMIPFYATQINNAYFRQIDEYRALSAALSETKDLPPHKGEHPQLVLAKAEHLAIQADEAHTAMVQSIYSQIAFGQFCQRLNIQLKSRPAGRVNYSLSCG